MFITLQTPKCPKNSNFFLTLGPFSLNNFLKNYWIKTNQNGIVKIFHFTTFCK